MLRVRQPVFVAITIALLAPSADSARRPQPELDVLGRPLVGEGGERLFYANGFDSIRARPEAAVPRSRRARAEAFNPQLMRDDATIGSFNQSLGVAGIHVIDIDGDALPEVLVGHTMMWYVVGYEPARQDYVQRYFYEVGRGGTFGGGGLVRVQPGDVDGDGALDIVTLLDDGTVERYLALSGAFVDSFDVGRPDPLAMICADVLDTRTAEILVLWSDEIRVFSFGNPTPLWVMQTQGATDLAAGQMDTDPAIEIAVAGGTGNAGTIFDAGQQTVQWSMSTGFGELVAAGDVDGDGIDEVIGAESWRQVMVIDVDTRLQKWAINNFNTSAIRARDTDGDGIAEVLMGDKQWGDVHILDGLSGFELGAVDNPEHSVAAIDLADVDGDCALELLWGAGYTSSGDDRLYVADVVSATIEWENIENDGPMHVLAIADLDDDGRTDVLRAGHESDAGYDGALVHVTDLHHRRDTWIPTAATNDGWMLTQGVAVANIDADPVLEYVMNDSTTYSGKVSAFDGATHTRQWTSLIFDGEYINSVAVGDPDRDGQVDFLIGTGREHTGAQGAFLRILRGNDGAMLWRSPALPSDWSGVGDIRVFDVDLDGTNEIVFLKLQDGLRVLDGVTRVEEWYLPGPWTALDVAELDGSGAPDIIVGDDSGVLTAFDGSTHSQQFQVDVGSGRIEAIRVADVDRDNLNEILLTLSRPSANGELQIRDVGAQTLLWVSPPLVGSPGRASSLHVADADDDGVLEVVVSTSYAIRVFEHVDPADVVAPTFTSNVGLQSAVQSASGRCCNAVDLGWEEADDDASPPVEYRVYRSTIPGFTPGPASYLARTGQPSYRDIRAVAGSTYHYVVRAVDRLDNEDGNTVERSVAVTGTPDPVPADQGNIVRAVRTGTNVDISFAGASGNKWRIFRDPSKLQLGATGLLPDLTSMMFIDLNAIAATDDYYYVLRGVSPCGNVGP